ncbi:hypothetical protein NP493_871g00041 [Ridgeia piscesae]|uniref:EF-hand domain-containing protein n=1 Tax=Ridgeia piscesae TaxID=27915 RepID=A0AAD9KN58_RIDPI|nr:hypothetical protein NP493_871g00041 [Ridgeia piscesae]
MPNSQRATSSVALKTVQDLLVDPPSAFDEIMPENRPTSTRQPPLEGSPDHDQGAAGEGRLPVRTQHRSAAKTEYEQNREVQLGWTAAYSKKMSQAPNQNEDAPAYGQGPAGEGRPTGRAERRHVGWTPNSVKMSPPSGNPMNCSPIPQDDALSSTYHSKLTNKVTEDLSGTDMMPIEERLARIQLKSLRPPPTPPSPYRMGRLHQPNGGKHVLETPWDLLPDESSKKPHPQRSSGTVSKEAMDQKMLDLTEMMRASDEGKDDSLLVHLNQSWVDPAYSALQQQKKRSKEDMQSNKVRHIVEEVIMVDQLSRSPISSPEQSTYPMNNVEPIYRPGMKRGTIRTLHESSVSVPGICTEKVLTKGKVYFSARILTRNGRDAIREITGFYFTVDNSLTLYEHREFSSKSNVTALPFIKRRVYSHLRGCRKGTPYTITDIVQGNNLEIKTEDQPVPDSMKEKPYVTFRITEVDNEAKSKILLDGLPAISRDEMWKRLHLPPSEGVALSLSDCPRVTDLIQNQIRYCGVRIWRNMDKVMRKMDTDNTGYLTKYELEKILAMFNIEVPSQMFNNLWSFVDEENTGKDGV